MTEDTTTLSPYRRRALMLTMIECIGVPADYGFAHLAVQQGLATVTGGGMTEARWEWKFDRLNALDTEQLTNLYGNVWAHETRNKPWSDAGQARRPRLQAIHDMLTETP